MYQLGHYGAALLVYAPVGVAVATAGFEAVAVVGAVVCVSLSTLPDCDHHLPLVAHRGPTHSVPFAALVGAALAAVTAVLVNASTPLVGTAPFVDRGLVSFAFVVGSLSILSHLLADAITPMGVRPFWPLSNRHYSAELTLAKNPVANYLLFGLGIAAVTGGAFVVVTG